MLYFAFNAEKEISVLIDYQCPQCGAPATLSDTDRLFLCSYCRVKSYLTANPYFHYLLPDNAPLDQEMLYVPYWRFKGMLFGCHPTGMVNRYVDLSLPAINNIVLPSTLGLRGQAMRLKFVTSSQQGRFAVPSFPFQNALKAFIERFHDNFIQKAVYEARIGESISLVYAPFYIQKSSLYDAILNTPVARNIPPDFLSIFSAERHTQAIIRFIPSLCPKCGWDLEGQCDTLALICPNCRTVWQEKHGKLKQLPVSCLSGENNTSVYLPFWRIKTTISGCTLTSYADLARLANFPTVIKPEWEKWPFFFWGPAFKIRPESYLRLCTQATAAQPHEPLTPILPNAPFLHSVSMPIQESIESLIITLANLVKPLRAFLERIEKIRIFPESYRLVYIPFLDGPHEFVQPEMNLVINKNQLTLSKNL